MYSNKKSTKVGSNIMANEACANLDHKYGLYDSVDEAYETLGEDNLDCIALGLTVGIRTENGVVEYWFKNGTTKEDLVLKGIDPSIIEEIKQLKTENEKLKQMLSTDDEDGDGVPDGEQRLDAIEKAATETMNEEDIDSVWNQVMGNSTNNEEGSNSTDDTSDGE